MAAIADRLSIQCMQKQRRYSGQDCYHISKRQFSLQMSIARWGQLPKFLMQRLLTCTGPWVNHTVAFKSCRQTELPGWKRFPVNSQQVCLRETVCGCGCGCGCGCVCVCVCVCACACVRVYVWVCIQRLWGGRDDIVYVCLCMWKAEWQFWWTQTFSLAYTNPY